MKMMYNGVPIKSLNIKHYEMNTNSATVQPSDLQAGVTCFARGKKVTGTGKAFSFAMYGTWLTNESTVVPMDINTIQISSADYPVRMVSPMNIVRHYDFSIPQEVAEVVIDGKVYTMRVSIQNGEFLITCEKTINIELFYGRDEYV